MRPVLMELPVEIQRHGGDKCHDRNYRCHEREQRTKEETAWPLKTQQEGLP